MSRKEEMGKVENLEAVTLEKAPSSAKPVARTSKRELGSRIKLRLKAYEHGILEKTVMNILSCVETTGGKVDSVIWLPLKSKLITVNRGPHIDKKAREQFKLSRYSAVLRLFPNEQTKEALKSLTLPYGVSIAL